MGEERVVWTPTEGHLCLCDPKHSFVCYKHKTVFFRREVLESIGKEHGVDLIEG